MNTCSREKKTTKELFRKFILDRDHPCIMAQTVFKMEEVTVKEYKKLGSLSAAINILRDLESYVENYDFSSNSFETFIATFPDDKITNEVLFEKKLWLQLDAMHSLDCKPWDSSVSSKPEDHNFSFSLLGKAFYIVGLHPNSSRKARQSPAPALVFNFHHQFEKLREMGAYTRIRNRIRKRDKKLQGSINPVLADFGNASEALQYSGRNVSEQWKCPFAPTA